MDPSLRSEARVFGRYLLGREPGKAFVGRYGTAVEARLSDPGGPVVRFVLRWPRALPFLDAAAALIDPRGPLRSRILVMAAVLEASPEHADLFLPRATGAIRQVAGSAISAGIGVLKAVVGLPLLLIVRRSG